jgi:cellulose synthase/poly-beta-1,6-N-acetylglucosamine synthase-like glycosyltransferase
VGRPAYSQGLLGANAAITRAALDRIGGLDFDAPTGTDYQLARRLLAHGIAIRYVGTSIVATEYPETLRAYRRTQSRWLRNLLVYGWRHGATQDVQATLKTVLTGLLMLFVPLLSVAWRAAIIPWALLVAHAAGSKLRYAMFTARLYGRPAPARLFAGILPLTLIDFAIWAAPILDLLNPKRRYRW